MVPPGGMLVAMALSQSKKLLIAGTERNFDSSFEAGSYI